MVSESDASSLSTVAGSTDAAATTSFDMDRRPPTSHDDLPSATSEGDLRETFDLPLTSGREAERGEAVSGAPPPTRPPFFRRSRGIEDDASRAAEARSKARRCVHCGSGVPQGMSICQTCGTDQETGMRVGLEDDFAPPPPPRAQGPPLHIAIIGGLCGTAALILMLAGVIKSTQAQSSPENYAWLALASVSAFGIFGCIQLIRGKSAKVLMLALTLGVAVDVLGLVAAPLIEPMLEDQEKILRGRQADRRRRIRRRDQAV